MQVCVIARDRSGLQHHNGNVCRARAKAPSRRQQRRRVAGHELVPTPLQVPRKDPRS